MQILPTLELFVAKMQKLLIGSDIDVPQRLSLLNLTHKIPTQIAPLSPSPEAPGQFPILNMLMSFPWTPTSFFSFSPTTSKQELQKQFGELSKISKVSAYHQTYSLQSISILKFTLLLNSFVLFCFSCLRLYSSHLYLRGSL